MELTLSMFGAILGLLIARALLWKQEPVPSVWDEKDLTCVELSVGVLRDTGVPEDKVLQFVEGFEDRYLGEA